MMSVSKEWWKQAGQNGGAASTYGMHHKDASDAWRIYHDAKRK